MAHQAQRDFFEQTKRDYPDHFKGKKVIDCGSLDVNGKLKDLFEDCDYTGVDIVAGPNVDIVGLTHELDFIEEFDTVVSAEMLEHDEYWAKSLKKMWQMLKPGGLLAISAAGLNRPEHGTTRTGAHWGTSNDYYKNLLEEDILAVFDLQKDFKTAKIQYKPDVFDIYFCGIKK